MTPSASARGSAAREAGRAYEKRLDATHAGYRRDGLASIERLPVPTNPLPGKLAPGYAGRARVLAASAPWDYAGPLGPAAGPGLRGRFCAMEAKASAARHPSLRIVPARRLDGGRASGFGLQEHQLRALALASRDFGAVAVVVVRFGDPWAEGGDGAFRGVLPPPAVEEAWRLYALEGRTTIPLARFLPYAADGYAEDWLAPVLAALSSPA